MGDRIGRMELTPAQLAQVLATMAEQAVHFSALKRLLLTKGLIGEAELNEAEKHVREKMDPSVAPGLELLEVLSRLQRGL
jgi:hypothetical protein